MTKTWANLGLDLHLDLPATRVRAGLEAALRAAVRDGLLRPGTRLPPSRALAADLGIARNSVADAYQQLVAEGWLTARTGAGTWVASHAAPAPRAPAAPASPVPPPRYDLRPGVPDLSAFPQRHWLAAARAALVSSASGVLGYPDPRGLPVLRTALAGYLARTRGVSVSPDRLVVCAGFAHGLALVCAALRARGASTLAVESHGHQLHRRTAQAQGLSWQALPVDADGARADLLAATGADAVLLTPAHQFPLGVTLSPQRRRAAVAWAIGQGGLVIEDDYDGEFRYDRQPVGALQALAPDQVIYAGTASKSLAPGLRLGWLAVPGPWVDEVVAAKAAAGAEPSTLDQLTLAELVTSGGYDRQIRHARLVYRRRRDRLAAAMARHVPLAALAGIAAGLHALLLLPPGWDEDEAAGRAAARGLAVEGLAGYQAGGDPHPPALVIGYASPADHAFTTALARLAAALAPGTAARAAAARAPARPRSAPAPPRT